MRILKCILTISPVLFRAHSMPHSPQIRNYETENSMFEHLTSMEPPASSINLALFVKWKPACSLDVRWLCTEWKTCRERGNVTQSHWIQITIESHLTRTVTELDMNTHEVKLYEFMKERSHIHWKCDNFTKYLWKQQSNSKLWHIRKCAILL